MSISPINHYALTTAQPGVINEEAYTVLDLVGKCGAKVNECVEAVNAAVDEIEDYDDRITAAQETADEAASTARAAMTTATENGQRITNVSAVAMEGRSVAFSARSAANAAQADADAAASTAQYAKKYVDDVTMDDGLPWFDGTPISNEGLLTTGFVSFLCDVIASKLNYKGKYYDLTRQSENVRNVLKITGYCATTQIDNGENCAGFVTIELNLFKAVSAFARASILVRYTQQIASQESGSHGAGSVFDVVTTISLPAKVYSASNQYDDHEFYCNRLCTYNNYDFQL